MDDKYSRKSNTKFLVTIGTCVVLLMVMFYMGASTSKKTYSVEFDAYGCQTGYTYDGSLKMCCRNKTTNEKISSSSDFDSDIGPDSAISDYCLTSAKNRHKFVVDTDYENEESSGWDGIGKVTWTFTCICSYWNDCVDPNTAVVKEDDPIVKEDDPVEETTTSKIPCNPGEYLPANKTSCETCTANFYCEGGEFEKKDSIQGRKACGTGKTSPTGSDDGTDCVDNSVNYECLTNTITKSSGRIVIGGDTVTLTADATTNPSATINHYEWKVGGGLSPMSGTSSKTITVKAVEPTGLNPGSYSVKVVFNTEGGTFNCETSGTIPIDAESTSGITADVSISPSSSSYTKGAGSKTVTVQYNAYDVGDVDCGLGSWNIVSNNSSYVTLSSVSLSSKTKSANKSIFTYSIKDSAFTANISKITFTATFTPTNSNCPTKTVDSIVNLGSTPTPVTKNYQCWFCNDGGYHWVPETTSPTQAAQSAGIASSYTCNYVVTDKKTESACTGGNSNKGFGYFYDNNGLLYQTLNCTLSKQDDGSMECDIKYPSFTCSSGKTFKGWVTSLDVCSTSANGTKAGNALTFDKDHLSYKRYACCTGGNTPNTPDTPNSPDTPDTPYTPDNPKTGNTLITLVWVVGLLMIGYSIWYFKKSVKNSD